MVLVDIFSKLFIYFKLLYYIMFGTKYYFLQI